ncbi:MAG: GNAT family N-acetyltransferase [Candidatus Omnitrophica bacterium]|nr:GNAT family N-acetyltransferase [bacterium]MBW7940788.1 GNAT family N-acetyltransferase [Candidatus Omnitrophota bacterium]MCE7907857.1 N-acetyltransferase [Candidatus Omnitrophica bacterium COP1]MCC6733284.1 GNAT family N-acetyltransferase [Candidatus Omnitrophota bacterium]MCK6496105.1 GNAT family N-acetyltransferase [bacterium]
MITYRSEKEIDLEVFVDLYRRSTLGERRPVDDLSTMAAMLRHSDVLITAWDGDLLVGLARSLTDYAYVAYLADLAVDAAYQRRGIGRELVRLTRAALAPSCILTLLAAPKANEYYPKIGFSHHPRAWIIWPEVK